MLILATIFMAWYFTGVIGFIYWWTHDHDFTTSVVWIALLAGVLGPVSWVVGCSIHGPGFHFLDITLIKRRQQ